jgi:hypothetical protein
MLSFPYECVIEGGREVRAKSVSSQVSQKITNLPYNTHTHTHTHKTHLISFFQGEICPKSNIVFFAPLCQTDEKYDRNNLQRFQSTDTQRNKHRDNRRDPNDFSVCSKKAGALINVFYPFFFCAIKNAAFVCFNPNKIVAKNNGTKPEKNKLGMSATCSTEFDIISIVKIIPAEKISAASKCASKSLQR